MTREQRALAALDEAGRREFWGDVLQVALQTVGLFASAAAVSLLF